MKVVNYNLCIMGLWFLKLENVDEVKKWFDKIDNILINFKEG